MYAHCSVRTKRRKIAVVVDNLLEEVRNPAARSEHASEQVNDLESISSDNEISFLDSSDDPLDSDGDFIFPTQFNSDSSLNSRLANWAVKHNITSTALKE